MSQPDHPDTTLPGPRAGGSRDRHQVRAVAPAPAPVRLYVDGGWSVGKSTLCANLCGAWASADYLPEPAHPAATDCAEIAALYLSGHRANDAAARALQRVGCHAVVERCFLSTYAYYEAAGTPLPLPHLAPLADAMDGMPEAFVILERTQRDPSRQTLDANGLGCQGQIWDETRLARYYRALDTFCARLGGTNIVWLTDCDAESCLSQVCRFVEQVCALPTAPPCPISPPR